MAGEWDKSDVTADVDVILGSGARRQEQRQLTETEREAVREVRVKEREANKARLEKARYDAQRNRVGYDLPVFITDKIKVIAKAESVSASGIAAALLDYGLRYWRQGSVEFEKTECDSPRFQWEIVVTEENADL